jgi:hypothetical protein
VIEKVLRIWGGTGEGIGGSGGGVVGGSGIGEGTGVGCGGMGGVGRGGDSGGVTISPEVSNVLFILKCLLSFKNF